MVLLNTIVTNALSNKKFSWQSPFLAALERALAAEFQPLDGHEEQHSQSCAWEWDESPAVRHDAGRGHLKRWRPRLTRCWDFGTATAPAGKENRACQHGALALFAPRTCTAYDGIRRNPADQKERSRIVAELDGPSRADWVR